MHRTMGFLESTKSPQIEKNAGLESKHQQLVRSRDSLAVTRFFRWFIRVLESCRRRVAEDDRDQEGSSDRPQLVRVGFHFEEPHRDVEAVSIQSIVQCLPLFIIMSFLQRVHLRWSFLPRSGFRIPPAHVVGFSVFDFAKRNVSLKCAQDRRPACKGPIQNVEPASRLRERDASESREWLRRGFVGRTDLIRFISDLRPDIEFRWLPHNLNATHLFRIRSSQDSDFDSGARWMPLQVRFATRRSRTQTYIVTLPSSENAGVVLINDEGCVMAFRRSTLKEGKHCFSFKHELFRERKTVVGELERWWADFVPHSEERCMEGLICSHKISECWKQSGVLLRRHFFDPLHIYLDYSGSLLSQFTAILDHRCKVVLRLVAGSRSQPQVAFHRKESGVWKSFSVDDDFEFLLVVVPAERIPESNLSDSIEFFMFPKQYLVDIGVVSTASQKGKMCFRIFLPWKPVKGELVVQTRKQAQMQYYVRSQQDFCRIWEQCVASRAAADSSSTQSEVVGLTM